MYLPIFSFHFFFSECSFTYEEEELSLADVCSFFEEIGLNLGSDPLQKLKPEYKQFLLEHFSELTRHNPEFHGIVQCIKNEPENNFFMIFHLGNGQPFPQEQFDKIDLYVDAIHRVENIEKLELNELPMEEINKLYQMYIEYYKQYLNPFEELYAHTSIKSNSKLTTKISSQEGAKVKHCRFCFKYFPEVTFKKKAHAISRGLGNISIFCLDECDECNEHFGTTIENDLMTFLNVQRMSVVNKALEVPYENLKLKNDGNITVIENISETIVEHEDFAELTLEPKEKFIPKNLYKALCKVALSIISEQADLDCLNDTIKWVRSTELTSHDSLMNIGIFHDVNAEHHVKIHIWTRKEDDKNLPFKIIRLEIGQTSIVYALPFVSNQNSGLDLESLIHQLEIFKNKEIAWKSVEDVQPIKIKTTFRIPRKT